VVSSVLKEETLGQDCEGKGALFALKNSAQENEKSGEMREDSGEKKKKSSTQNTGWE
jgi:hypothetical protein